MLGICLMLWKYYGMYSFCTTPCIHPAALLLLIEERPFEDVWVRRILRIRIQFASRSVAWKILLLINIYSDQLYITFWKKPGVPKIECFLVCLLLKDWSLSLQCSLTVGNFSSIDNMEDRRFPWSAVHYIFWSTGCARFFSFLLC